MADVDLREIESDEEGYVTCYVAPTDLFKAKDAIEAEKGETNFVVLENKLIPQEYIELSEEDKTQFNRLLALLDDCDDVQQVYHNVENIAA